MGIATSPLKSLPDDEQSFSEMLDRHKRHLGYLGLVLLLIAGGVWFYARSKTLKERRAETAYVAAMQSVYAGNVPLAQADLKKMSVRYAGTAAGTEGGMALAKLYYDQGKFQDGLEALKPVVDKAGDLEYDVRNLIAAGYEGMAKLAEAAVAYEGAAKVARFPADADRARASAARAYQLAGKRDDAIKIWQALAKDPSNALAPEARVRLGELEAKPIKV